MVNKIVDKAAFKESSQLKIMIKGE